MTEEIWRDIDGAPNYQVSDHGRIRSLLPWHHEPAPRLIYISTKLYKGRPKALFVRIVRNGRRRNASVHRLVLRAFVGPCPLGMEGCHNDGNASNNYLINLRWDTKSENQNDSMRHGTKATVSPGYGENHWSTRLIKKAATMKAALECIASGDNDESNIARQALGLPVRGYAPSSWLVP